MRQFIKKEESSTRIGSAELKRLESPKHIVNKFLSLNSSCHSICTDSALARVVQISANVRKLAWHRNSESVVSDSVMSHHTNRAWDYSDLTVRRGLWNHFQYSSPNLSDLVEFIRAGRRRPGGASDGYGPGVRLLVPRPRNSESSFRTDSSICPGPVILRHRYR